MIASGPKQQVLDFRREKYGIDEQSGKTNLNPEVRDDYHNAIQNLSEGLYSKESHFVFELIQNAEDNEYAEGVAPELVLDLLSEDPTGTPGSEACLCIYNNEAGFELNNIKAISGIGKSTKAKAKDQGYIGEKGIGFKSVFAVSPSPHIFSNGFHIYFKKSDPVTELGFIIPYWLDEVPAVAQRPGFNTCILLPLKSEKGVDVVAKVTKELKQISAETTLFLRRLSKVSFTAPGYQACFSKTTSGDITTLSRIENGKEVAHRYWMQSRSVEVPDHIQEEKRVNVVKRDITLAFPLERQLSASPLFAYLPTELATGLPFLVNADFLLAASREAVSADSAWNQWMRDEIVTFASDILTQRFATTNDFSDYSWLPNSEHCSNDFLEPIYEGIYECLRDETIIPDRQGVRRKANDTCFDTGEKWFDALKPVYDSPDGELYLIHRDLYEYQKALDSLGVYGHFFDNVAHILGHSQGLERRGVNWYLELYQWLMKYQGDLSTDTKSALRHIPLVKSRGGLVATGVCKVYEPSTDKIELPDLRAKNGVQASYQLISQELQQALAKDRACREFVRKLFKIESLNQTEFLSDVALPFCKENLDNIEDATLWSLSAFVFKYWSQIKNKLKKNLRTSLPLRLEDDTWLIIGSKRQLATPTQWTSSSIWQTVYQEDERDHFSVLSNRYLEFNGLKDEVLEDFFDTLMVCDSPAPKQVALTKPRWLPVSVDEPYHFSAYIEFISAQLEKINATRTIRCSIDVLPAIFFDQERLKNSSTRVAILGWVDGIRRRSSSVSSGNDWKKINVPYFNYTNYVNLVDSPLFFALKRLAWLPSNGELYRVDELFLSSPENIKRFGDAFRFVDSDFDINEGLAKELGLSNEISEKSIVSMLVEWSSRNKKVDIKVMESIYQRLAQLNFVLSECFAEKAIIYCPAGEKRWCRIEDAVWESQKGVFGSVYHWLSEHYSTRMQSFWLNNVGVAEHVETKHFAQAWLKLQELPVGDGKKLRKVLPEIYRRILEYARALTEGEDVDDWWNDFICLAQCYTRDNRWEDCELTYIGDLGKNYNKAFLEKGLPIFWRERGRSNGYYTQLYKALGLNSLAESVEERLVVEVEEHRPSEPFLTRHTKLAISSYIRERKNRYGIAGIEWLSENNDLHKALQIEELCVEQQSLRIELSVDCYSYAVEVSKEAYFDSEKNTLLYASKEVDRESQKENVASEITRLLFRQDLSQHEDTILRLLGISSEKRYKALLERKGWLRAFDKEEQELLEKLMGGGAIDRSDPKTDVDAQQKGSDDSDESASPDANDREDPSGHGSGDKDQRSYGGSGRSGNRGEASMRGSQGGSTGGSRSGSQGGSTGGSRGGSQGDSSGSPRGGSSGGSGGTRGREASRSNGEREAQDRNGGGRLLSYVEPSYSCEGSTEGRQSGQERIDLGDKAEELVEAWLNDQGYKNVTLLGGTNKGYDIEAFDPETGEALYIEVKAVFGAWNNTGVSLSSAQYQRALEDRHSYWLVVVENMVGNPSAFRIADPATKVEKYFFDKGWIGVSDPMDLSAVWEARLQRNDEPNISWRDCVDDPSCIRIVEHIEKQGSKTPELGYEILSNNGEVVGSVELAWPENKKAIVLSTEEAELDLLAGWDVRTADWILDNLDWLPSSEEHVA